MDLFLTGDQEKILPYPSQYDTVLTGDQVKILPYQSRQDAVFDRGSRKNTSFSKSMRHRVKESTPRINTG